jgi:hypothetical protein
MYIFLFFFLFFTGCGKRPRSLIPQQSHASKPSTFAVPRATKLSGASHNDTIQLSWPPVADVRLHSYAIYKFAQGRFLRHKPFSIVHAPQHTFVDSHPYDRYKHPCYAVRPCYLINSHMCMGALSNVLCFEKR